MLIEFSVRVRDIMHDVHEYQKAKIIKSYSNSLRCYYNFNNANS